MEKIKAYTRKTGIVWAASAAWTIIFVLTVLKILSDRPETIFSGLKLVYSGQMLPSAAKILFWVWLILFVCVGTLIVSKFLSKQKRFHVITYLTALFLTFALVLGSCRDIESPNLFYVASPIWRAVSLLVLAFGMYMVLTTLYSWFDRLRNKAEKPGNIRHATGLAFVILLVLWMPIILSTLPGSICYDSAHQIGDFMRGYNIGIGNPIMSTVLYGGLFSIGMTLGGAFFADVLLVAFQTLLCASAMAAMTGWVYRRSRSKVAYWLCLFILGVVPVWAAAVQCALKDTANIGFFIYFMLAYADIILDGEKVKKGTWIRLFVFAVLSALSKSFVDSVIVLCLVVLVLVRWKQILQRKRLLAITAGLVVIIMAVDAITTHLPIFQPPMHREKYSLPLQQVARYCKEYGDEMTPEQIAVVDQIMDFDAVREVYDPNTADPVKRTYHASEEEMKEFWKLYFELGMKHPGVYLKHILAGSYKYFYPFDPGTSAMRLYIYNWEENGVPLYELSYVSREAARAAYQYVSAWSENPLLVIFIGPGFYVDAFIVLLGYVLERKNRQALLVYVPLMLLTVGLLFTHVNGENRYAFPIMGTLALTATVALLRNPENQEQ